MIDKQKVLDAIDAEDAVIYRNAFREVVKSIPEETTTVDNVVVKSHKSETYGDLGEVLFCSQCGSGFPFNLVTKYCPNCGRRVVKKNNEEIRRDRL